MRSVTASARASAEPVVVTDLGLSEYQRTWDLQRELATSRADGEGPDTMLLLEHPPTYTAGRRTEPHDRPVDGTPVIDVDRGGKITWHGPGQLVGYPIIKLAEPIDVVDYVRRLEQGLIAACESLGLECGRIEGRSGVWLPTTVVDGELRPERKVAAIGVRVQRGVTLHGFAINCDADLSGFGQIIPCGIPDAGVGSLSSELGRVVAVAEVRDAVRDAVLAALDGELPVAHQDIRRPTIAELSRPATPLPTLRLA
ncbi:lipoyl(octanoyl) transferase LipB [Tomitella biformata]|uniref:lipoyl(octanoyl) transferase LipB n=1 Tax=Tomitella biformata TaxID=630403 RepID=UPI0004650040|nr:lipoyl(octanoyl) transferase LipB [Tomitella biformata]